MQHHQKLFSTANLIRWPPNQKYFDLSVVMSYQCNANCYTDGFRCCQINDAVADVISCLSISQIARLCILSRYNLRYKYKYVHKQTFKHGLFVEISLLATLIKTYFRFGGHHLGFAAEKQLPVMLHSTVESCTPENMGIAVGISFLAHPYTEIKVFLVWQLTLDLQLKNHFRWYCT